MRGATRRWVAMTTATVLFTATAGALLAQAAAAYEPGQTVEVREGDAWSKASIVAKEGRRYQIRYADGTDEWVTADRIRTAASGAKPSTQPATAKPKPAAWQIGQDVEVKWGGLWRKARIANRRGEWLLVEHDRGSSVEWVEPWRIRKIGETQDVPYAPPNMTMKKTDPPPRDKPGAAPEIAKAEDGKADPFAPQAFGHPVTPADTTAVTKIVPAVVEKWSYAPAAAEAMKPLPRPLPTQGPLHVGAAPVAIDVAGDKALVAYVLGRGDAKGSSAEILEIGTGKGRQVKLDTATRAIALTPDGRRIIARAEGFFGGTKHRVDVWDVVGAEAKHMISFVPHPSADGKARDIDSLLVIDDGHIVTSSGGEVTCWKLDGAKALWTLTSGTLGSSLAQSPDRKTLAVAANGLVCLVDAATGNLVGSIAKGVPEVSALAFSPSGKRLFASTAGGGVATIDLASGEARPVVAVPGGTTVLPLSDRLLDLGVAVVDVDRSTLVAKLERANHQQTRIAGSTLLALIGDGKTAALSGWKLPIPELEKLSAGGKSGEAVRLGDGASVSLDVSLPVEAAQSEAIVRDLRAGLENSGVRIVDGATIRVVARIEDGKTEERLYESHFSRDRERLKVTVTEKVTRLWIEASGKKRLGDAPLGVAVELRGSQGRPVHPGGGSAGEQAGGRLPAPRDAAADDPH